MTTKKLFVFVGLKLVEAAVAIMAYYLSCSVAAPIVSHFYEIAIPQNSADFWFCGVLPPIALVTGIWVIWGVYMACASWFRLNHRIVNRLFDKEI